MLLAFALGLVAQNADLVDAHVHIAPRQHRRAQALLDAAGVDWALNLSGGWPGGLLEAQRTAAHTTGRWLVAVMLPWRAARDPDFPGLAVDLLFEAAKQGARALKVQKALGLAVRGPDGDRLAVDDPWLDPIWRAAGHLGLPVVIHSADPKAFWAPPNPDNERWAELRAHPGWSYYGVPGVPDFVELLEELENVVARHPNTTFVSVHFGNHAEDPWSVEAQLARYPNLYVDIAARIVELGRHHPRRLARLFQTYSDRILFGTDLGLWSRGGIMLGSTGPEPDTDEDVPRYYAAHRRWLETPDTIASPVPIQGEWDIRGLALDPPTLERVYRRNAEALFGPPPWAAEARARYPPFFRAALE